ncbi:MAG: hypothetical protein E6K80_00435 [Candidatus Eisenbacteria bacterium]|uniref:RNA-binding S4 domain-containing protein n=1 Tax=Eiseniibacteriota bacterium TaxID=2212470 RepID=A0A538UBN3_UNCEI|nr:MAG: hypothetical protein E6K80_00435 [Candidatus Eisenbacteria bacterium]
MRLDVLLHELRLFKSRSQAAAAIDEGRIMVAGRFAKASRAIAAGERITIVGPRGARTLEVLDLPRRSMSKAAAQALVREVEPRES